jgi:hypothetical protein
MPVLRDEQREELAVNGFVRIDGFAERDVGEVMLERVIELAHRHDEGADLGRTLVLPEQQGGGLAGGSDPEDVVSKIFLLARDTVFREFVTSDRVGALVSAALGLDDIDNFLSQFIFKNPGAWGQPWHQDSFYFPFDPPRPVIGLWLAVTEATLDNGCLHVLPGSHLEPVHLHEPDHRPNANYGYVEIVDHDTSAGVPVLMQPGDVLVFDSHLMHRSTDNVSESRRAAMVFHFAAAGTVDRTEELRGYTVNDWLPVWRAGRPAG